MKKKKIALHSLDLDQDNSHLLQLSAIMKKQNSNIMNYSIILTNRHPSKMAINLN